MFLIKQDKHSNKLNIFKNHHMRSFIRYKNKLLKFEKRNYNKPFKQKKMRFICYINNV